MIRVKRGVANTSLSYCADATSCQNLVGVTPKNWNIVRGRLIFAANQWLGTVGGDCPQVSWRSASCRMRIGCCFAIQSNASYIMHLGREHFMRMTASPARCYLQCCGEAPSQQPIQCGGMRTDNGRAKVQTGFLFRHRTFDFTIRVLYRQYCTK